MTSQTTAHALNAIRSAEETLLQRLPQPTALLDAEGHIVEANPALAFLVSAEVETLAALPFREFVTAEFRARYDAFLCFSEDYKGVLECQLRTTAGKTVWVLLTISRADAGVCLQCVSIDEQKTREQALQHREQRLLMALDSAGQGVWDVDIVAGRAYYSDTWKAMRGYRPDEDVDVLGGPWLQRLHPDDRDRIEATISQQNVGKIEQNAFEYRERHRDGHWMWIFSRGRPVEWLPNGHVARILGTDTNITSLKDIESRLAEEKARLLVTLRSIADGMISMDADFRVTLVNGAAEKITNLPAATFLDRPIAEVFDLRTSDGAPLTSSLISQCVETGMSVTLPDDAVLYQSSRQIYLHCSISPVKAPDGGTMGVVMVFRDTTDDQLARRALAHSATHDALTGLANRYAFEREIEMAIASARQEQRRHVLCYLDLDGFKGINDLFGHAAGDDVLRKVAEILSTSCRASDFIARLGGDEFSILLTDCPIDRAEMICNSIVSKVAGQVFAFRDQTCSIGVSIGIAAVDSSSGTATAIREKADAACYQAKAGGKGRVVTAA